MDPDRVETARSPSWEGPEPELSILIPTYDRAAFLDGLIDALEAQRLEGARFEVVIVDNGSHDATWEALRRRVDRTPLRMLTARISANRGPAAARNLAARLSRSAALAFTDDDCLPSPAWAAAMAARFEAGADLVQGPTLPDPSPNPGAGAWDRTIMVDRPSPLFETCNIGYRRSVFERAGGFDDGMVERQHRMPFGEDVGLGWRARSAGAVEAFADDAVVHHRVLPGGFKAWMREQRRLAMFPTLVKRNPGLARELFAGVFLTSRTAAADLAAAGVLAAALTRRSIIALAVVPWIATRWKDAAARPGRPIPVRLAQLAAGDAVGLAALALGSMRARRLVL